MGILGFHPNTNLEGQLITVGKAQGFNPSMLNIDIAYV